MPFYLADSCRPETPRSLQVILRTKNVRFFVVLLRHFGEAVTERVDDEFEAI